MYIQQVYTNCLSEAAYYIESNGAAVVIDPMRDYEQFVAMAKERNAEIKFVFETHFHADFVSGHIDLSKATGAPIVFGPDTKTSYPVQVATDGQIFQIGALQLKVLHTPGHTLESTCYLLHDEAGKAHALFSGDTLFVGDVGRPDLSSGELTSEELAGMLFESIQEKIMPLGDEVLVFPAHGPGSSCGKNLGPNKQSTIGEERKTNYALQPHTKEEFVAEVLNGLGNAPSYFAVNAKINQQGYESFDALLEQSLNALSVDAFKTAAAKDNVLIIDTRHATTFTQGFVPGSIFIGLEGRYAEWAASLLPFDKELLIVAEPGKEKESIVRLTRVGFNKFSGYLAGGFESWKNSNEKIDLIVDVEPDELAMDIPFDEKLVVLDVRRETEYADGHIKKAVNIPLSNLIDPGSMADLDEEMNLYVHCAGGYRSVIASSIMKREGIHNVRNVLGGWNKIKLEEKIETVKETAVLN
jgi:hydroxyacylglutathione hydrolase